MDDHKPTERYSFGWSEPRSLTHGMTPEKRDEFWRKMEEHTRREAWRATIRSEGPFVVLWVFAVLAFALWRYSVAP